MTDSKVFLYTKQEHLVSLALELGGTIFGGYVRDLVAGDKPHDLDVFFTNEKTMEEFVREVHRCVDIYSQRVEVEGYLPQQSDQVGPRQVRLMLKGLETFDQIDCLVRQPNERFLPDADVNGLIINGSGLMLRRWQGANGGLAKVISHCRSKSFVSEDGMNEARIQKMLRKGWTHLNKS